MTALLLLPPSSRIYGDKERAELSWDQLAFASTRAKGTGHEGKLAIPKRSLPLCALGGTGALPLLHPLFCFCSGGHACAAPPNFLLARDQFCSFIAAISAQGYAYAHAFAHAYALADTYLCLTLSDNPPAAQP